jgi:FMN phosphatase YigB (HAD superfamily)
MKKLPRKTLPTKPMIRLAIFDLDDTLYDCLKQRVQVAHRHASRAMVRAGVKATVEQVFRARMQAFAKDPHLKYIDAEVGRRFNVKNVEEVSSAAREAYFSNPVGRLTLFPESLKVLRYLHNHGVKNFIVTYGDLETQSAKVSSLKLDCEKSVEKILYADRQRVVTKEQSFQWILQQTGIPVQQALVVGDRPANEIAGGNRLGMHTVRMKGGEFAILQPQSSLEDPDYEITKIQQLLKLPFQFGAPQTTARPARKRS